jgi:hypothetical protein
MTYFLKGEKVEAYIEFSWQAATVHLEPADDGLDYIVELGTPAKLQAVNWRHLRDTEQ